MHASALALLLALGASAQAQQKFTTLFAQDTGGLPGWGVYFDVNVLAQAGLTVTALEVNIAERGIPCRLDLWTRTGTYSGYEHSTVGWTRVRVAKAFAAGAGAPSVGTFTPPLVLGKGITGCAIVYNGVSPQYTIGTGANQFYANSDLTITCGNSRTLPFQASGTVFNPRVWNGSLYYDTAANPSSFVAWGSGCAGSNGTPALALGPGGKPKIGTSMPLAATNLTTTPNSVLVMIGVSRDVWSGLPLPFDLALLNMQGCLLLVSTELILPPVPHGGGSAATSIAIPNVASLVGGEAFLQAFAPDPTATGFQARVSNAAQVIFGL